jgi:ABC-2 type transport system permease protein
VNTALITDLRRLLYSAHKEGRILSRDPFTLVMLFVMPVVFVLILSLALRDAFGPRPGAGPTLLVSDPESNLGPRLARILDAGGVFAVALTTDRFDLELPQSGAARGEGRLMIGIPPGAAARVSGRAVQLLTDPGNVAAPDQLITLAIALGPGLRPDQRQLAAAAIDLALRRLELEIIAGTVASTMLKLPEPLEGGVAIPPRLLFAPPPAHPSGEGRMPSAVQQNAPAWILLAMFFLAVPLSVSFIRERAQGSLARLQLQGIPAWVVLGGKALPYLLINMVQFLLVLGSCVYLLPRLGGDTLSLGRSWPALLAVGLASSMAAIGFGSLVAVHARTAEQATTFAATAILILAAVGGVLVPKLVMPGFMQELADLSPLSWGLDGFLVVFVEDGGLRDVLPACGLLIGFSAVAHLLAIRRYRRRE